MPAPSSCPVPELDRVLSPYINSKQDILRIRATLSTYLASHLKVFKSDVAQHLDRECPHNYSAVNANSSVLKDSRLRYLRALEDRVKARKRHMEIQASLEELRIDHSTESSAQPELAYDSEATRSYVSLLRQRRLFAELQVIQHCLEKLLSSNPLNGSKDPKALVKEAVGEQPDLPAERLEQLSQTQNDDTPIFKLKKEVLEAKLCMDRAKAARTDAQSRSRGNPSVQQQVHALGCARDEIVAWVEGELAKMNEDSVLLEDASPVKRMPRDAAVIDITSSEERIRTSYNQYTASRAQVIGAHGSVQSSRESYAADPSTDGQTASHQSEASNQVQPATDLLPRMSSIARILSNERSLLQQAMYLQGQLSSATEEINESLSRLAEESHLLSSRTKDPTAWGKTAMEMEAATREFVIGQLQESRQEVNNINTIVELCSLQSKVLSST